MPALVEWFMKEDNEIAIKSRAKKITIHVNGAEIEWSDAIKWASEFAEKK